MAISDETLALAIPPELKTDHPDASLVVQGILVALAANENSGAMTAKGRMRDTFAALQSVYVPIFRAHIAKEDEDWNALRSKAEKYVPTSNAVFASAFPGADMWNVKLDGEYAGQLLAFKVADGDYTVAEPSDTSSHYQGATLREAVQTFLGQKGVALGLFVDGGSIRRPTASDGTTAATIE